MTSGAKFLTADTNQGKQALEYLNAVCQEALTFAKKSKITSYEDFSSIVTQIGKRNASNKGDLYAVRAGVVRNDLVLSLANKQELGATNTIKMSEHLGLSKNKFKFTRQAVEKFLQGKDSTKNLDNSEKISSVPNQDRIEESLNFSSKETVQEEKLPLDFSAKTKKVEPAISSIDDLVDDEEVIPTSEFLQQFSRQKGVESSEPVIDSLQVEEQPDAAFLQQFSKDGAENSLTDDSLIDQIIEENDLEGENVSDDSSTVTDKPLTFEEKQALRDAQFKAERESRQKEFAEQKAVRDRENAERKQQIAEDKQAREQENLRKRKVQKKVKTNATIVNVADTVDGLSDDVDAGTFLAAGLKMGAVVHALSNGSVQGQDKSSLVETIRRMKALQDRAEKLNERSQILETPTVEETIERVEALNERATDLNKRSSKLGNQAHQDLDASDSSSDLVEEDISENKSFVDETEINNQQENQVVDPISEDEESAVHPGAAGGIAWALPDDYETVPDDEGSDNAEEVIADQKRGIAQNLQDSVNKLNETIEGANDGEIVPIEIDQNAELSEQLAQINKVLDQLEFKLDKLEERIEKLEAKLLDDQGQEPVSKDESQNLVEIPQTEVNQDSVEPVTLIDNTKTKLEEVDEVPVDLVDNTKTEVNQDHVEPVTLIENKSDFKDETIYAGLLATLNEVDVKYYEVNPDHNSVIEIGANMKIVHEYQGEDTIVKILQDEGVETREMFNATVKPHPEDSNTKTFVVETDLMSEGDLLQITDSFDRQLDQIDQHLQAQRKEEAVGQGKEKQTQLSM